MRAIVASLQELSLLLMIARLVSQELMIIECELVTFFKKTFATVVLSKTIRSEMAPALVRFFFGTLFAVTRTAAESKLRTS